MGVPANPTRLLFANKRWNWRSVLSLLILLVCYSALWLAARAATGLDDPLRHDYFDQHTRQAQAWLQGHLSLDDHPAYLELVDHENKTYSSFPPTPALVEIPFVLFLGTDTPNDLVLFLFAGIAAFSIFRLARRFELDATSAAVLAFMMICGTNLFYLSLRGAVWHQGQVMGFAFAVLGLLQVVFNRRRGLLGPTVGYVFLSLAVGCRPFYAVYLPLYLYLDVSTSGRKLYAAILTGFLAMLPMAVFMAAVNYVRFGSIFEFGHALLSHSKSLPYGVFSLHYFPDNAWHVFANLPSCASSGLPLSFDGRGTAFWINNTIFLIAIAAMLTAPMSHVLRGLVGATIVVVWFALLMHESNGWFQFGYRYVVDLLPAALVVLLHIWSRVPRSLLYSILVWSVSINFYGAIWWSETAFSR